GRCPRRPTASEIARPPAHHALIAGFLHHSAEKIKPRREKASSSPFSSLVRRVQTGHKDSRHTSDWHRWRPTVLRSSRPFSQLRCAGRRLESAASARGGRSNDEWSPTHQQFATARLTPGRGDFPFLDFTHTPPSDRAVARQSTR